MDQEPLVREWIDAARKFLDELEKELPVQAAFWLKEDEDSHWNLYVATDRVRNGSTAATYDLVGRVSDTIDDSEFRSVPREADRDQGPPGQGRAGDVPALSHANPDFSLGAAIRQDASPGTLPLPAASPSGSASEGRRVSLSGWSSSSLMSSLSRSGTSGFFRGSEFARFGGRVARSPRDGMNLDVGSVNPS